MDLYIPEEGHTSFGVVRAVVKDAADVGTGAAARTFLDSDGQVGVVSARNSSRHLSNRWHMVCTS